jgi:hypothetical protein
MTMSCEYISQLNSNASTISVGRFIHRQGKKAIAKEVLNG